MSKNKQVTFEYLKRFFIDDVKLDAELGIFAALIWLMQMNEWWRFGELFSIKSLSTSPTNRIDTSVISSSVTIDSNVFIIDYLWLKLYSFSVPIQWVKMFLWMKFLQSANKKQVEAHVFLKEVLITVIKPTIIQNIARLTRNSQGFSDKYDLYSVLFPKTHLMTYE